MQPVSKDTTPFNAKIEHADQAVISSAQEPIVATLSVYGQVDARIRDYAKEHTKLTKQRNRVAVATSVLAAAAGGILLGLGVSALLATGVGVAIAALGVIFWLVWSHTKGAKSVEKKRSILADLKNNYNIPPKQIQALVELKEKALVLFQKYDKARAELAKCVTDRNQDKTYSEALRTQFHRLSEAVPQLKEASLSSQALYVAKTDKVIENYFPKGDARHACLGIAVTAQAL